MGILEGKRILVTGLTAESSIAFHITRIAQAEGAQVVVSNYGRAMKVAERAIQRLDVVPELIELDVTNEEHLESLKDTLKEKLGGLDGVVHSIAYSNPRKTMGGAFLTSDWDDVAVAFQVSSYSLVALTRACQPIMGPGSSVVGLTFDGSVSWPAYDWMGVAKSALEAISRYVSRYMGQFGIRSNLVAAGPVNTLSKKSIPGMESFDAQWQQVAPLGWNPDDHEPPAKAVVALLSDWFPKTTGDIIYVDGGMHATGA
ncbi:MAG: enoyl-ACP reductase FabI [Propionibacteriaceae bacterium]|jgi:enoyl-[acyl-carrier protein] reductase I|nr:enoyl-ACP reductase FabI [Propionibacteriaceae bacterium]